MEDEELDQTQEVSPLHPDKDAAQFPLQTDYNRPLAACLTASVSLGAFLFGYDTSIIGAVNLYIEDQQDLSVLMLQTVVTITVLGSILGAVASGWLADAFGRKWVIWWSAVVGIGGSVIMAAAPDIYVLLIGRFIVGLVIGVQSMVQSIYLAEVAPAHIRGAIVSALILFVTGGQLIAYIVGVALGSAWRWMFALGVFPALVQIVSLLFLPESPRWLVKTGATAQAQSALLRLRTPSNTATAPDDSSVHRELTAIQESLTSSEDATPFSTNVRLLFQTCRAAAITGIGLQALQQLVGINSVMYYGPFLMRQAGFDSAKSQSILATLPLALSNFLGTIVAVLCIERLGRRGILLWTAPGIAVVCVGLAICYGALLGGGDLRWFIFCLMVLYVVFFAVGFGATPWAVNSEIYALQFRSTAASLATTANWTSCLVMSMFVLLLATSTGGIIALWVIFAGFAGISYAWVFFRLPETKGRSLEDIAALFEGKPMDPKSS